MNYHRSFSRLAARASMAAAVACFVALATVSVRADEQATNNGPLTPSEQQFVASVRADLMRRFPHVADAVKAGYVRYTGIDDTGAISYADDKWNADPTHPSQLWYDEQGNLMGADFSVPRPHNEVRPMLWGIDPGRWYEFNGHVHYVVKDSSGKMLYDLWVWNDDFTAAGGSLATPSADTLAKMDRIPAGGTVTTIFDLPTQWDLIVWLRPHSAGLLHW